MASERDKERQRGRNEGKGRETEKSNIDKMETKTSRVTYSSK